ncbi:gas vesicle protein GvpO [Candidatus Solirubrobacter pratensis]|uniref:gas vesicle protein GvpO n=1 Tax=Candidatus Solirubrobacter pratensis TaxID=1298857 RepID=UPI000562C81E|nr:gas vesicle protein [Candidatus Solirubrobacter pratensis]
MSRKLLHAARQQVAEVTGRPVETISGFHRNGDGWVVTVEVLELERVPNTMDLLATYAVTISDDGDVLGFERRRRYHRAAVDEGG